MLDVALVVASLQPSVPSLLTWPHLSRAAALEAATTLCVAGDVLAHVHHSTGLCVNRLTSGELDGCDLGVCARHGILGLIRVLDLKLVPSSGRENEKSVLVNLLGGGSGGRVGEMEQTGGRGG